LTIGLGASAGLATEAVYGTYVNTLTWTGLKSHSIARTIMMKESPALLPGVAAMTHASPNDIIYTGFEIGGDFSVVPTYGGVDFTTLLRHAFAAVPVDAGVVGNYTHTFVLGDSFPGLSIQLVDGTDPIDTNVSRRITGCLITSWTFSVTAQDICDFSFSVIASGETAPAVIQGVIAFPNNEEIVAGQASAITWNALTLLFTDIAIKHDHKLVRTPEIGNYGTGKPSRSDKSETTVTGKVYCGSNAVYLAFLARTISNLVLTFVGSGTNQCAWTVQDAVLISCEKVISGPGEVYYQCTWRARSAVSTTGLRCVVTNSNATWNAP
jgi:Phage tail tube protein